MGEAGRVPGVKEYFLDLACNQDTHYCEDAAAIGGTRLPSAGLGRRTWWQGRSVGRRWQGLAWAGGGRTSAGARGGRTSAGARGGRWPARAIYWQAPR